MCDQARDLGAGVEVKTLRRHPDASETAAVAMSKSQANKLGDKIRKHYAVHGSLTPDQRDRLEEFVKPHMAVMRRVQNTLIGLGFVDVTPRLKNLSTIAEKLVREKTRLSRIEDIAGVRVVISGTRNDQDDAAHRIASAFPGSDVHDRRARPSFGYRAVHVIACVDDRYCEIQVRTPRQHQWAEISERLGDAWGRDIRYGGAPIDADRQLGPDLTRADVVDLLSSLAEQIADIEMMDASPDIDIPSIAGEMLRDPHATAEQRQRATETLATYEKAMALRRQHKASVDKILETLRAVADVADAL